ncbi:phage integrase SAM-like domain-containing protein [Runella slithyformis]|uniref:Integrase family protein n=1 Tax=Runella slithyformis (strain ATCC 29530 / DSM 19594 / LMG 11500 / NCIMB 11436 / LSU 4) TaxID=761193 RepID=A0A7U3ZGJ7_RUNSL|nr:phage integrase SAM-like domain-containing protein [Runella slithyformis]AEI46812.1 integrase family protein [Runella slithyformis DSM 19594]
MTVTPELNNRPNKNGLHTIQIRITHNRKLKRIALEYAIPLADWNPEKKEVRKSNPLHLPINAAIKIKVLEAQQEALRSHIQDKPLTATQLKKRLKKQISGDSFIEYAQKRVDETVNPSSKSNLQSTLNKFKEFLKQEDLLFPELDYDLIKSYQRHLKKIGNATNTIYNAMKNLRATYNEAIAEEVYETDRNPWKRIKLKKEKTIRRRLNMKELLMVEQFNLRPGTAAFHSRHAFMLGFYLQGARVTDLLLLTWANIKDGRCEYYTNKGHKFTSKKIPAQALPILKYFRELSVNPKPTDYILPFIKLNRKKVSAVEFRDHIESVNAQMNGHLYEIADKLQIPRFSMHTGRHTFANNAIRASNGNIHAVSDAMGHSSIQITEQYFDAAYRDENDALGDMVFGS